MLAGNEGSFGDEFEKEIGMLLREQRRQEVDDRESELNIFRSGSAPPTVEGSLNAVGGLFAAGGGGGGGESEVEPDKVRGSAEWGVDGLIGLPGLGLGNKQKSLAEIFQDDLGRASPVSGLPSRPASRNAFDENVDGSAEADLAHLHRDVMASDGLRSSANGQGSSAAQTKGSYSDLGKSNGGGPDFSNSSSDRQVELQKAAVSSNNLYLKGSPTSNHNGGGSLHPQYQQVDTANSSFSNYGLSGYSMNPALASMVASQLGTGNLPPLFESAMGSPGMDSRVLGGVLRETILVFSDAITITSIIMLLCSKGGLIITAIEVVDLDQKIKMVEELDGHVMRCVRDQNGNHVIQKCIECVPEDAIHFIVSTFFDQVVTLSTHPYGCRVIQRVLEHCNDMNTQGKVMDEILGAVSMLAQDQYGNYVVQHVLEHGKPHERSAIIKELAGKIVQMSQQKFASNVVEKCLTFGGPAERELLVKEMLGTTDENEPLQAMMKDQFANYVVQKVLETCDDQQRELILSRIKVHLNALKKYTYGKHIVARVEKLVAAGERRIAAQSSHPV
ncbi:hypothetical protein GBA52_021257 [Prunus armeniaca]|nr:hypothetical protein GBA52_021257 [Prunus armeniaca]